MLNNLCKKQDIESFSVSPENPTGEKGMGGRSTDGAAKAAARELGIGWKVSPYYLIAAGETITLADVKGSGAVKHMWITYGKVNPRNLILRFYWDGSANPSIEAPLGDFFASAQVEDNRVNTLAVCCNPNNGLNCYWEMPFRTGFRVTLENLESNEACVYYQLDCERKTIAEDALYFHAQFRRVNPLPYGQPYTILDNITGNGCYVGTYLFWGVHQNGWWGEGEMKFYLDGDKDFPSICGTGTEDYFCGAYNFDRGGRYIPFSTPYSGMQLNHVDECYAASRRFHLFRWHIQDPIYFKKDIKVTIQALGWRSEGRYLPLQDDISSVAYWYSDTLSDIYPTLPDKNGLEII